MHSKIAALQLIRFVRGIWLTNKNVHLHKGNKKHASS